MKRKNGRLRTTLMIAALSPLPETAGAEISESGDGRTRISITMPENEDIRGKVSQALFAAGCAVLEMQIEKASLENIFLELTDSDGEKKDEEADEDADVLEAADRALADAGVESFSEDEEDTGDPGKEGPDPKDGDVSETGTNPESPENGNPDDDETDPDERFIEAMGRYVNDDGEVKNS